jgi:hypothetical protein
MTRNPTHDSARRAMVERIAHAPRRSAERAANYAALHDSIARERNAVAQQLDQVRVDESANSAALKESALAQDRTWPFLLLERASLDALAASIRHAVLRARRDPLPPPRAHPSGHA